MDINQIYESKYIKAADLQGKDVTVVIANAEVEKMGEDRKLVVYFQGHKKGLVTNRTNANRIAHLYGNDTDGWVGKEVTLYVDLVDFQGRTTEAVRIRPPLKKAEPATNGKTEFVTHQRPGYQMMEARRAAGPRDDVPPPSDNDLPPGF